MQPRFRLFAGPNGSGKTHLFDFLRKESHIQTEIYVNADSIEQSLTASLQFYFNAYSVKVSDDDFKKYIHVDIILQNENLSPGIGNLNDRINVCLNIVFI